jgi:hypothetical protein
LAEDGTTREIAHVADEEIERAIVLILERALSLSPDELIFRSSRVFGFQRAGRDIRDRISSVMETMTQSGTIQLMTDRVQLGRVKSVMHGRSSIPSHLGYPPSALGCDWSAVNV